PCEGIPPCAECSAGLHPRAPGAHMPFVMGPGQVPSATLGFSSSTRIDLMKHPLAAALAIALTAAVSTAASAQTTADGPVNTTAAASPQGQSSNPLFVQSPLPLRYPQFDKLKDEHFAPAFDSGMARNLEEIRRIASEKSAPTFENTILALEKSGQLLDNARRSFGNLNGADTNDTRKQINNEYAPKFAAHRDAIMLDPQLFERVQAVYNQRDNLGLDAEGVRLVEEYHDS